MNAAIWRGIDIGQMKIKTTIDLEDLKIEPLEPLLKRKGAHDERPA